MRLSVTFLCVFLGILNMQIATLNAQDRKANEIVWEDLISLPDKTNGQKNLGVAGAFTGIHQDVLIVAGGANFPNGKPWEGGKKVYQKEIFVLKKKEDSYAWTSPKAKYLNVGIAYGSSVTTPEGIVCLGGEKADGVSKQAFIMQWDALNNDIVFKTLPDIPIALANAGATHIGNVVYIVGGENGGKASNAFYAIDLSASKPVWESLPSLPVALSHMVVVAQNNGQHANVYVLGGRASNVSGISDLHGSVFAYDPVSRLWNKRSAIGDGKTVTNWSAGTGLANGASYIILFGGDNGKVFNQIETFNAQIAKAEKLEIKEQLQLDKLALLTSHQGFDKTIYLYNTITDAWTNVGELTSPAQVTTTAVKWDDAIFIPSGEIKPGTRSPMVVKGEIQHKSFFSWIDSAVLAICFLLMTAGRFLFTGKTTNTNDYFKGGERIPQWAAGISIFGAKLSAITFMGIPAKTYGTNWTYFFLLMTILMVMPLVAKFFIPFYRRLHVTSAYEYLGKRFNYGSRIMASTLYILLQIGRMGIVVLLPSIALTLVTGININLCIIMIGVISIFFTVKGGIEAVIWVEVIQVMILAIGALFCLFYLPFQIHDWDSGIQAIGEFEKLKVFDFRFDFNEPTFWVVVIGGLAINLLTYGTDQTTVQRYLTTKSEAESIKSLKLGAWLALPSTLVFFSIGTLLFLFFREQPLQVNMALNDQDNIFPWYIVSQLPVGLSGLLIAGIFAAAMSSTEASMNSTATLLTTDFYQKFRPDVTPKQTLFFARTATLLLGIFVTCIALYMANKGVSSLWDKFNTILGLFTGCIGGAFILGIFTKKASGNGVMVGMVSSCITQIWIQQFTDIHLLMYAFTGLISCVLFGYIFSLIMPSDQDLTGLTMYSIK